MPKKILLPNTSYITNHFDNVARLLFTKLNNSSHTTLNKHEYVLNTGNQRTKHTRTDDSHLTFSYDRIGQLTIARATKNASVNNIVLSPLVRFAPSRQFAQIASTPPSCGRQHAECGGQGVLPGGRQRRRSSQ